MAIAVFLISLDSNTKDNETSVEGANTDDNSTVTVAVVRGTFAVRLYRIDV